MHFINRAGVAWTKLTLPTFNWLQPSTTDPLLDPDAYTTLTSGRSHGVQVIIAL